MHTAIKKYWNILKQLLLTDLIIYKRSVKTKIFDYCFQICVLIGITSYLMPAFGLIESYGVFEFASLLSVIGLWEVFPDVATILMDLEGNQYTSYQLTLPLPTWLIWLRYVIFMTIKALSITLFVLPAGTLVLWNTISLNTFNILQFCVITGVASIFYGVLSLWALTIIEHMGIIGKLWNRYLFPLWFLGCYQFSWHILHQKFPRFSYLVLLNPLTYIHEAARAAVLGQSGFISFWTCIGAILIFIVILWIYSIRKLRKKMDSV